MRNLSQVLNHGLVFMIKSNQNGWLKPCIDMNTDLRQKAKNAFETDFFKLMNNAVFRKNKKCEKT